ncbi:MAG: hypothetical protein J6S67_07755 [Methanobrevibacter sp.]|nr:hypothetical protein [Methanobrevibacter sp.]
MASKNNLPVCRDPKGQKNCFAKRMCINGKPLCICLSDTATIPCPFYKPMEQVQKENSSISD